MRSSPIGIFDSGLGGLSVWQAVVKILPRESIIYLADNAHCPYGSKSISQIKKLSARLIHFLIAQNCKLIIVACNTASVNALDYLRSLTNLPIIGIEPATKVAVAKTKTGSIGILATQKTFKGQLFQKTKKQTAQNINVYIQPGTGLVELVESGRLNSIRTRQLLTSYLNNLTCHKIDQLVLGCTHYPFLIPLIKKIIPTSINIINPAPSVARQTKKKLAQLKLLNPTRQKPSYIFLSTGKKINPQTYISLPRAVYQVKKIKL